MSGKRSRKNRQQTGQSQFLQHGVEPASQVAAQIQLALQHHQAGRLQQAEQIYRQVLKTDPENADANHLLGVIAHQVGRNDIAVQLIRKAISINPNYAEAYSNLGNALQGLGQLEDAIASCKKAISIKRLLF